MSLKKTACLIFHVRHCMHHFNLQNGNGFEDNIVSSYRLVLGQEHTLELPSQSSILDSISILETRINPFYYLKIQADQKKKKKKVNNQKTKVAICSSS